MTCSHQLQSYRDSDPRTLIYPRASPTVKCGARTRFPNVPDQPESPIRRPGRPPMRKPRRKSGSEPEMVSRRRRTRRRRTGWTKKLKSWCSIIEGHDGRTITFSSTAVRFVRKLEKLYERWFIKHSFSTFFSLCSKKRHPKSACSLRYVIKNKRQSILHVKLRRLI